MTLELNVRLASFPLDLFTNSSVFIFIDKASKTPYN